MQRVLSATRLAQDHTSTPTVGSSSTSSPSSSVSPRTPTITMAANNSHEESRFWTSTDRGVVITDAAGEQYSGESKGKHAANNITGFLGGMLNRERKRSTKLNNAPMVNLPPTSDSRHGLPDQRTAASAGGPSASPSRSVGSSGGTPKMRKLKRSARPSTANDVDRPRSRSGLFSMLAASRSEHDLSDPTQARSRPSTASGVPTRERIVDDDNVQEVLVLNAVAPSLAPRRSIHSSEGRQKRTELPEALRQMSINAPELSSPSESESSSVDDNVDLSQFPLPVRLGIVPPSELTRPRSSRRVSASQYSASRRTSQKLPSYLRHRPQYVDGYYLCTPPPSTSSSLLRGSPARSSYGTGQVAPTVSPIGRARGNSDARRTNFFSGPGKLFQSESGSIVSSYSLPAKEAQMWAVNDYFRVERVRRPGQFGVSELKTHAYSHDEAPYPFSYGPDSMSSDMLMHITIEKAIGLSTLQWPHGPPRRVLDIGCGIGAWVMDMASRWPDAEFIGLDLVPIQRRLDPISADGEDKDAKPTVGSMADLQRRVSWVVANVLQGLPFPDASFDCVNMTLINSGIPQDSWPALLSEVSRVLTPGGQLQVLEWDFSFFGSSKEINTADLMNLILGNPAGDVRTPAALCRAPTSRNGDANTRRRDRRNNALETIFAHALCQRNVSLIPSTMLEQHLRDMDDVANVFLSEPRTVPILSRTHRKTFARTRLSDTADLVKMTGGTAPVSPVSTTASVSTYNSVETAGPTGLDELIGLNYAEGQQLFASTQHAKQDTIPELNVRVHDLDAVRMAIMTSDALRYSDSRHFFWQELETLRRQDAASALASIRNRVAAAAAAAAAASNDGYGGESGSSSNAGNAAAAPPSLSPELRACLQRWPTFSAFECDIDAWKKEVQLRADSEELLRHKMRWGDAATRMDGWQQSEKMRKRREQQYWSAVNDKVVVQRASYDEKSAADSDASKLRAGGTAMLNAFKTQAAHAAASATAVALSIQQATPLPDFVRPDIANASVPFADDTCAEKAKTVNHSIAAEDDEDDIENTVTQPADITPSASPQRLGLHQSSQGAAPEPAHEITDILGFRVASLFNVRKRDLPHGAGVDEGVGVAK